LGIARKLHISRSDLAEANDLSIRARLSTGQALIVPTGVRYVSYTPAKKRAAVSTSKKKKPAGAGASRAKATRKPPTTKSPAKTAAKRAAAKTVTRAAH